MIMVGTTKDYNFLTHNCDGRCMNGLWCVLADGEDRSICPIYNEENFILVKNDKYGGIEVE